MTILQFFLYLAMFSMGTMLGVALMAVLVMGRTSTMDELVDIAAGAQDTKLLDFAEKSECSLFFNPVLAAWGLLDGQRTVLSTGHSIRTTLARAIDLGAQDV